MRTIVSSQSDNETAKMFTKRLSKYSLDLAVLVADGYKVFDHDNPGSIMAYKNLGPYYHLFDLMPSRNPVFGSALLKREGIEVVMESIQGARKTTHFWIATKTIGDKLYRQVGETRLMAGMRCFVQYKIGDTFSVPLAVRKRMQEYREFDRAMREEFDMLGEPRFSLKPNFECVITAYGARYIQKPSTKRQRTRKVSAESTSKHEADAIISRVRSSKLTLDTGHPTRDQEWVIDRPDGTKLVVHPIVSKRRANAETTRQASVVD